MESSRAAAWPPSTSFFNVHRRTGAALISSLGTSSPGSAVAGRDVSLPRWDRRLLDHWLQDRDLGRETTGHGLREASVEPAELLGLEEVTPRGGPTLQLDLRSQEMLDLDDALIEKREVGHSAGRSILEMESDLDAPAGAIGPHFIVNPIVAIVELEQHRIHAMSKLRQFRRQVRSRICRDRREEIAPIEIGWTTGRPVRGCHSIPLAIRRPRLARPMQYAMS